MNARCYAGYHLAAWLPVGILCTLLLCCGIPLAGFIVMWWNRHRLEDASVVQAYGFMYKQYRCAVQGPHVQAVQVPSTYILYTMQYKCTV